MWDRFKRKKLNEYLIAKNLGDVDEIILPILDRINSFDYFCTISSCSGRISIIDTVDFGNKREAKVVEKWHDKTTTDKVLSALKYVKNTGWFKLEPPIFHVGAKNLDYALKLMKLALRSGFKKSSIIY